MPNAEKLKKLADLRRARGKSQKDAALYFGLADSARNEISKWENGEKVPPAKYRERFIDYLCDFLNLGADRERFDALWTILSEEWEWDRPTEQELRKYFPPTFAAHISGTTYASTKGREYHLLGMPVWSVYEHEGRKDYRVFGVVVWSSAIPTRPRRTLVVIATLAVALFLGMSLWGLYYLAQYVPVPASPPAAVPVTVSWDLGADMKQGAVYINTVVLHKTDQSQGSAS